MGWKDDQVVGGGGSNAWQNDQKAPFIQRAGRYARGLIDEAANFGTGLSDEFGAAVDATIPTQFLYPTSQADSWSQRYTENLGGERGRMKQFRDENPVAATTADVTGAVTGAVAALPARLTAMGPSLVGNVAKMGGTGAGLGAVSGFGQGEGGFDERLGNAILPATLGGVLGGLMPLAGAGGRALMESAPGRAISKNVIENGMIQRLASALQRGNLDPAKLGGRLDELGEYGTLADTDRQIASMVRASHTASPTVQAHAKEVLEGRTSQLPGIVRQAFEGAEPPPSTFALKGQGQAFDQNISNVGRTAYQGDMVEAGLAQSPELRAMLDNPWVDEAIKKVLATDKAARVGRPNAPPMSQIEVLNEVQKMIRAKGFVEGTAIPGPNMQPYRDVATDFANTLRRDNPALDQAMVKYHDAKSLPEFFDQGYNFMRSPTTEVGQNSSTQALADALAGANTQQAAATRAGATNVVRDRTLGPNPVSQARAIARDMPTEGFAPKIEQIYGAPQAAQIQRAGDQVRTFTDTSNYIRGGSNTVDKSLEVVDDMANIGIRGGPQGITGRMWQSAEGLVNRLLGANESVRQAIGKAGLNTDTAENRRILALAAELLKKRAAGSPVQAGLIEGAAASQAGGP